MKEIIIDGIVYDLVERTNTKTELDVLKEKYGSGEYICIGRKLGDPDWWLNKPIDPKWYDNWEYKLIHKKHRKVLDAWLKDNSVEIEIYISYNGYPYIWDDLHLHFIEDYDEQEQYRLK